jgi:hypothetical protein
MAYTPVKRVMEKSVYRSLTEEYLLEHVAWMREYEKYSTGGANKVISEMWNDDVEVVNRLFTGVSYNAFAGVVDFWKDGKVHRDDGGPAMITNRGQCYWVQHGVNTREDGLPTSTFPCGYREWSDGGRLHRDDGPWVENHTVAEQFADKVYSLYGDAVSLEVFELHYMLKYRKVYNG